MSEAKQSIFPRVSDKGGLLRVPSHVARCLLIPALDRTKTSMRRIVHLGLLAAFLFTPVMAKSAHMQDAFKAALGLAPPVMRYATLRHLGERTLRLEPAFLAHLRGKHYALTLITAGFRYTNRHFRPSVLAEVTFAGLGPLAVIGFPNIESSVNS